LAAVKPVTLSLNVTAQDTLAAFVVQALAQLIEMTAAGDV
jgi:hypothetical protein